MTRRSKIICALVAGAATTPLVLHALGQTAGPGGSRRQSRKMSAARVVTDNSPATAPAQAPLPRELSVAPVAPGDAPSTAPAQAASVVPLAPDTSPSTEPAAVAAGGPATAPSPAALAAPQSPANPPEQIVPSAAAISPDPLDPTLAASQFGGLSASIRPPPPMSEAYRKVLLQRSIFSKDHNHPAAPKRTYVPTVSGPRPSAPSLDPAASEAAEANFMLKGVGIEDELPTAFFERASDSKMVRVHLGQGVSHGQISAITLDGVDYAAGQRTVHVNIGQSLSGITTGRYTGSAAAAPTTAPTTQPAGSDRASSWIKKHHED